MGAAGVGAVVGVRTVGAGAVAGVGALVCGGAAGAVNVDEINQLKQLREELQS